MTLDLPTAILGALLENGEKTLAGIAHDPMPVVKLHCPDTGGIWLLAELDPRDPDRAFGLCDPLPGAPRVCTVSLAELGKFRGPLGLAIERDLLFQADRTLRAYGEGALAAGRIIA
ncbi:hypothetical protein HNP52_002977 [Sphingomonas kyeonggiensis]|uniref:DUF2958 domain-containing protein n=1 Tax=Sphingomonas kyeonggiensis TaxID=1268553 RepID=A0A7W7NS24_9SPHN|nr:DUF2958 domain-containing protein [Sphingomonas kyeonggiensis]MBB4839885.1 hypothetical protein [Sphingomonas kyeonggiensis]